MSKLPVKSKFRVGGSVSNNDHRNTVDQAAKMWAVCERQKDVIDFNNNFVGKTTKRGLDLKNEFKKIQLSNNNLVIHAYLEDIFKEITFTEDGKANTYIASISQIDARRNSTEPSNWVVNPIPIISKGIIMSISPFVVKHYDDLQKQLGAENVVVPKVGDTVYLNHFMTKDSRFYLDKQKRMLDSVKSQTEYHLNEFDMLFMVDMYTIEAVVPSEIANTLIDSPTNYPYLEFFNNMTQENVTDCFKFFDTEKVIE